VVLVATAVRQARARPEPVAPAVQVPTAALVALAWPARPWRHKLPVARAARAVPVVPAASAAWRLRVRLARVVLVAMPVMAALVARPRRVRLA
jgi:hypothetical protein